MRALKDSRTLRTLASYCVQGTRHQCYDTVLKDNGRKHPLSLHAEGSLPWRGGAVRRQHEALRCT